MSSAIRLRRLGLISSGNEKTIRRVVSQYVSDEIEGGDGLESLSSRLEARFGS